MTWLVIAEQIVVDYWGNRGEDVFACLDQTNFVIFDVEDTGAVGEWCGYGENSIVQACQSVQGANYNELPYRNNGGDSYIAMQWNSNDGFSVVNLIHELNHAAMNCIDDIDFYEDSLNHGHDSWEDVWGMGDELHFRPETENVLHFWIET